MKKILLITLALFATLFACAQRNYYNEISAKDLPKASIDIINKYFGGLSMVSEAQKWPHNYDVELNNGQNLDFYRSGKIKEARSNGTPLPIDVLSEFPKNISSYIKNNYENGDLIKVEVDDDKIEIKLEHNNQYFEIKFSKSGELIKVKRKN